MTILVVLDEGLAVGPRIVTVNPQFDIYRVLWGSLLKEASTALRKDGNRYMSPSPNHEHTSGTQRI